MLLDELGQTSGEEGTDRPGVLESIRSQESDMTG